MLTPSAWGGVLTFSTTATAMNLPVICTPMNQRSFPILDVESLIERLPAQQRADLVWAVKPIKDALGRLCREPLTDQLLREASLEVMRPLYRVVAAFWHSVVAHRDEWRAILMDDLRREQNRMRDILRDEEAGETLDWVFGFLGSFLDLSFAMVQPEHVVQMEQSWIASAENDSGFLAFAVAQATLMAVVEGSKSNISAERAGELLDVSFLEFVKVRNDLQRSQIWISAFPHESIQDRRGKLLASVARLRQSLTDTNWQVVRNGRMGDLR